MADDSLVEPLVADAEGYASFPFDEALLKELAALDAAEAGDGAAAAGEDGHVDDEDVDTMRELIREKPKDVIQYLEEEGVVKLGEFDVQDAVAFRAFGKEPILTMGTDHFEMDYEAAWRERLAEYGRAPEVKSALGWSTKVKLEAHVVNLRDAAAEGSKGLLHPLLKRYHAHACSATVFGLPAVQAVIHYKWEHWARTFLLYELACYAAWLTCFTTFTLIFQAEDWTMTFQQLLEDRNGFLALVFSLLSLLPMGAFLYMELCTIAAYGWGWCRPWNILDMASYILQVVICVLHLQRTFVDEGWMSVLVATQHVLLWMKLHYFAKAFNPTKNTIVDTIRIVVDDMKWFLLFVSLTMTGFGLAFYALFRQDRQFPDFANVWHAFASMYSYMLAMFDYNVFYGSTNPTAAMILFIIFEFIINVLLLNALIASMTNSLSRLTQDEGLRFLCSKAEIIDELETTLPAWVRSSSWTPAFIAILKIHPDATYEVNLSSVWSGIGVMENNLLGAQNETRLRVEALEDKVGKLSKRIDVLIKLIIASSGASSSLMGPGPTPGAAAAGAPAGAPLGRSSCFAAPGGSGFGYASGLASPAWRAGGGGSGSTGGPLAGLAPLNLGLGLGGSGGAGSATPSGPMLRHAATYHLSHLPEQLTAVSGPLHMGLAGPVLGLGSAAAQHGGCWPGPDGSSLAGYSAAPALGGASQATPERSGYASAAAPGSAAVSRTGSGSLAAGRGAGGGSGSGARALFAAVGPQHGLSPTHARSGRLPPPASAAVLALQQQAAWHQQQLALLQQQFGLTPAQAVRAVLLQRRGSRGTLSRSQSL